MEPIIGIDLGTTHSLAAQLTENGPRIIPNAMDEPLTPSVVGIDPSGKLLVGMAAKELQVLYPERCASLFKRRMGSDWKTELVGRPFTPEELSSLVLRSLKEDAEACLGRPLRRAVVTVPAYFNDQQRKATLAAGQIAGLKVERIFNEPTAAALAYGFHEARENKTLIILDLGGGTFDVSLVEMFDGVLEVKASAGETWLGGEDFTRALAARILESQGLAFEKTELHHPRQVARLVQLCEVAKLRLSRLEETDIRLPTKDGDLPADGASVKVTRQQFQAWTAATLARMEWPIRRVLGDAGLKPQAIDEVILAGGATRMPAVVHFVGQFFGKPPQCRHNPDEVIALGAAVQAGLIGRDASVEDMVVTDVAPFTLGIAISKIFGSEHREGYFLPIIHRNSTIPLSRVEPVATLLPNQTDMRVQIYQGEGRRIEDNLLLGEFTVTGIPRGPAGQPVDIRFTYDLNGVLEIEATVVPTRQKMTHVITRLVRGLNAKQIEKAVAAMAKLKTHPREERVNQLLLRRAERVFRELSAFLRDELSMLLDGFEAALGAQEPQAIARHREALELFLSRVDIGWTDDEG